MEVCAGDDQMVDVVSAVRPIGGLGDPLTGGHDVAADVLIAFAAAQRCSLKVDVPRRRTRKTNAFSVPAAAEKGQELMRSTEGALDEPAPPVGLLVQPGDPYPSTDGQPTLRSSPLESGDDSGARRHS